jgi:hypothetical protein
MWLSQSAIAIAVTFMPPTQLGEAPIHALWRV